MTILIAMRLSDMQRVHPQQITGHCELCGHEVGIYPSGQQAMREHPDLIVLCQVCQSPGPRAKLAPGAALEPFQARGRK